MNVPNLSQTRLAPDRAAASEPNPAEERFTVLLSPTRRGARLARRLTERQLADWAVPSGAAEHIVAELAANAVQHGRVPGRDFRLTLTLRADGVLRIAVTDARAGRLPACAPDPEDAGTKEGGRGLMIVEALADDWGVDADSRPPARKTVWAVIRPVRLL